MDWIVVSIIHKNGVWSTPEKRSSQEVKRHLLLLFRDDIGKRRETGWAVRNIGKAGKYNLSQLKFHDWEPLNEEAEEENRIFETDKEIFLDNT